MILSAEAVESTQKVTWEGRTIHINFDVELQHAQLGISQVTVPVEFTGQRYRIEKYNWTIDK